MEVAQRRSLCLFFLHSTLSFVCFFTVLSVSSYFFYYVLLPFLSGVVFFHLSALFLPHFSSSRYATSLILFYIFFVSFLLCSNYPFIILYFSFLFLCILFFSFVCVRATLVFVNSVLEGFFLQRICRHAFFGRRVTLCYHLAVF